MNRIGRDFGVVEVEYLRQNLKSEPSGETGHAFIDAGEIAVFLIRLGMRIGIFQILAVIPPHLGKNIGVFRLFQAG
jgi:hypothetical protein